MDNKSTEQISLAAKNYADALIQLGRDNVVSFDALSGSLRDVNDTFEASYELKSVLNNPSITEDNKIDILNSIFEGKIDSHILNFLKILIQRDRMGEFGEIYADFVAKLNNIRNIQPVTIVSAVELRQDYKDSIVQKLNSKLGKTVEPEWHVDESIIAGLTVKINDDVIDMSLKNRIDKLSKSLMLK